MLLQSVRSEHLPVAPSLLGAQVAEALSSSWRADATWPAEAQLPSTAVVSRITAAGCGALLWRRVRTIQDGNTFATLRELYRMQALATKVLERDLVDAVGRLRTIGIDPVLVKGWAIARDYPERGSRPCGDIDLCVPPAQHERSRALLEGKGLNVDLHPGFPLLEDRAPRELLRRERRVVLDGTEVRMLGEEDHLRLVCLHALKHGLSRALWLVDVAVAVESRSRGFDWDYFFAGDAMRARWLECTLGLAAQLLGAEQPDTGRRPLPAVLPSWLAPATLDAFGVLFRVRLPVTARRPMNALRELSTRWPNGIEASFNLGVPFDERPRLPYQLAECVRRSGAFVAQAVRARTIPG